MPWMEEFIQFKRKKNIYINIKKIFIFICKVPLDIRETPFVIEKIKVAGKSILHFGTVLCERVVW